MKHIRFINLSLALRGKTLKGLTYREAIHFCQKPKKKKKNETGRLM